MNIKKLREELKSLLEDDANLQKGEKGFSLFGKNKDVNDLLDRLNQEYGDLTIPEFIDMLIQKEKQGEDVLDESLNESSYRYTDIPYNSYNTSHPYDVVSKINSSYSDLTLTITPQEHSIKIGVEGKYIKKEATIWLFMAWQQKSDKVNEWLGYFCLRFYDPQPITSFLKDNTKIIGKDTSSKYHDDYDCLFGKTLSRRTNESNIDAVNELIQEFNNLLQGLNDSLKGTRSKYDLELEELEKVRAQAKSNKTAATTTVRSALSKSAVAKKIQALQNPTPEQLAKILAAIE